MKPFHYTQPKSIAVAQQAFSKPGGTQFIAGGTNLLDLMKKDVAQPANLVDINALAMQELKVNSSGAIIGALVPNSMVAADKNIQSNFPLLSKAILAGASAQIRNMATTGGNMLQRTRCPYFYDVALPCNKRNPGSGCGAREGLNRMSAIFGASQTCVAVHPSDMCVALAALDSTVTINNNGKTEKIPFADFHRLPGTDATKDNNLPTGAIITQVTIPANLLQQHNYYLKIRDRSSYAFALVSVAAALQLQGDTIKDVRLAAGGVAHKPWRLKEAENYLKGKPATAAHFAESGKLAVSAAQPLQHNSFKITLLQQSVVQALQMAMQS